MNSLALPFNQPRWLTPVEELSLRVNQLELAMLDDLDRIFERKGIAPKHLRFAGHTIKEGCLIIKFDSTRLYHLGVDELISAMVLKRMGLIARKEVLGYYSPEDGLLYCIPLLPSAQPPKRRLPDFVGYDLNWKPASPYEIPLGVLEDGVLHTIDLLSTTHFLVVGASQSGKSSETHSWIATLLRNNTPEALQVAIFDPKGEFTHYKASAIPHLIRSKADTPEQALDLLKYLVSLLDERRREFDRVDARNWKQYQIRTRKTLGLLIVVVDEFVDLIQDIGPEFTRLFNQLTTKSASYGVRVMATTASPIASVMDTTSRGQFDNRICFRVKEEGHSAIALGRGHGEATRLPNIKGRFIAWLPDNVGDERTAGQGVYVDDEQLDLIKRELARTRVARRDFVIDQEDDNPADGQPALEVSEEELSWLRYAARTGGGFFDVGRLSAKFGKTNNNENPIRLLAQRLEAGGWLLPRSVGTSRPFTDKLLDWLGSG